MKTIKKTKQVEYEIYQTSDGKEFEYFRDAKLHEDKLTGTKKDCAHCLGKGKVNIRTETTYQAGYGEDKFEYGETCQVCGGKGYLELNWK